MSNLADRISNLTPGQLLLWKKQLEKKSNRLKSHTVPLRDKTVFCPLSLDQEQLWFIDQLEPNSSAYNLCAAFRLTGIPHPGALEESLIEIVRRHETLRTTFAEVNGVPHQVIAPSSKITLEQVDLSQIPEAEREKRLQKLINSKGRTPFNLATGPLFRPSLLHLTQTEQVLVITWHHIITDKFSHDVLWGELAVLYDAYVEGKASPLPELPIQYADYAQWQRQWLQGEIMQTRLSYWKKKLAGAPFILELPVDHPRPAVQTYRGKRQYSSPSDTLWAQLKALGRREKASPFMTFLAAFYVWLYRYTGQTDLLVGTPFSNREMAETKGLIGFLLSTLVLRVDLSGNPSFRELLGRVRESSLGAFANNLPFAKLIQELKPERDLSRNPLFQVAFLIINSLDFDVRHADLTVRRVQFESGNSNVDLMLGIRDDEKAPTIIFEYCTDLFEDSTIARMMSNFEMLLEGIVSDPEKRLTDLPFLTAGETTQLLQWHNNTGSEYSRASLIQRLFEEQAARTPDAIAVIFETQQLSYAELNEQANRVACQLRGMGVGAGTFVGLYVERSLEMLVGLLGILKAGGAYVPLDPSYPPDRLSYILKDAKIQILVTQNHLPSPVSSSELRRLCLDSDWAVIAAQRGENLSEEMVGESPAYVIYTSGSTGRPKGVQVPHRAVANLLESMRRQPGLTEVDTILATGRLSFDMSVLELLLTLMVGARVVIAKDEVIADGSRLSQMLATCGATAMAGTPATWGMLIKEGWQGKSGFKILCGGEAMSRSLADQLLERGAELWNFYGPTETTVWSSIARVGRGDGIPVIGNAINNTQLYVLGQNFCLAPIGVSGQLYIGGAGLAHGYLNLPDLTAEKFIPDPFSHAPGARLYRTGDVARVLPDGNVEFLGRLDHQVKLRGFRIELGEIESVLNEHTSIRESVVVLGDDGAGDKRLIAYLVTENGVELAGSELRQLMQEKLPAYMIPTEFVSLDEMPLTPNGKIDRQSLPAPTGKQLSRENNYVIPRTPLENSLADIWAEILQLEQIGAADNFFELGGHSLTATRVISQVRDHFQVEISLRELFDFPTVAELAQRIEIGISRAQREKHSSIVPVPRVRVRMADIQPPGTS